MLKNTLSFCLSLLLFTLPAEAAQTIRVGIVEGQRSAEFFSEQEQKVFSSGVLIATFSPGSRHFITANSRQLKIDGQPVNGEKLEIASSQPEQGGQVNHRSYRGAFSINLLTDGNSLNVVNILPLEEYLYSVVGVQLKPLWPKEAAKAQAVVSRTIAMQAIRNSLARDYDIAAMYRQSYFGKHAEKEQSKAAVDATVGEVVLWQGAVADVQFFLSGGGRTEDGGKPYLPSLPDHDQDFPGFAWEKMFTAEEIDNILMYAGYQEIGRFQGFEFSTMDARKPGEPNDRGKSGRLKEIKVIGDRGYAMIPGSRFAAMLRLPSSEFDILVANLLPQLVDIPITDPYGNVIGVKQMPVNMGANHISLPFNRPLVQRVAWAENEKIVIKGRGAGDGIGFSQWGARGLALAASDADGYYKNVLSYYFPGCRITALY